MLMSQLKSRFGTMHCKTHVFYADIGMTTTTSPAFAHSCFVLELTAGIASSRQPLSFHHHTRAQHSLNFDSYNVSGKLHQCNMIVQYA